MLLLDQVGTLRLFDTGVRCPSRNVKLLRIVCVKCTDHIGLAVAAETLVRQLWAVLQAGSGYHKGCAQSGARPPEIPRTVCPACGNRECPGDKVFTPEGG